MLQLFKDTIAAIGPTQTTNKDQTTPSTMLQQEKMLHQSQ
jgi:hypothetical protein